MQAKGGLFRRGRRNHWLEEKVWRRAHLSILQVCLYITRSLLRICSISFAYIEGHFWWLCILQQWQSWAFYEGKRLRHPLSRPCRHWYYYSGRGCLCPRGFTWFAAPASLSVWIDAHHMHRLASSESACDVQRGCMCVCSLREMFLFYFLFLLKFLLSAPLQEEKQKQAKQSRDEDSDDTPDHVHHAGPAV